MVNRVAHRYNGGTMKHSPHKTLLFSTILTALASCAIVTTPSSQASSIIPSSESQIQSSSAVNPSSESQPASQSQAQPSSQGESSASPSSEAPSGQSESIASPSSSEPTSSPEQSSTQTVFSSESQAQSSAQQSSEASSSEESSQETLPAIDYVKVFAPASYSHIWAWTGDSTNVFSSSWPGEKLQDYNDDWKTYDFPDYKAVNVIFSNNGNGQTADLKDITHPGYWWYLNGKMVDSNVVPSAGGSSGGGSHADVDIPTGNHTIVKKAASWQDFPLWSDLPSDHWKTISPYKGSRDDFRDESIYFTITTRFYDGDSSNNARCWDGRNNSDADPAWRGDFKGLIEKMDYIKALGFTAIWITPVVENASGYDYHGYHALNFKKVDKRYESEDVDFQEVIKQAHARDMKIILDVVFNHTGNFGEENLFPMFYKYEEDTTIDGMLRQDNDLLPSNYASLPAGQQYSARINAMKNFPGEGGGADAEYIYHHEKNMSYEQYIEQTGQMAGDCVDLNTENPTVCNYLVEAYGEFIRMGVDAFRIDTMKHISRLTFNNYLWPAFYEYAKKCGNNHFFMFGEVCTRVREVWNHGQACDSAPFYTWKESKNYSWGDIETNMASTLQNWNDNANTNQPTTNNAYLSNGAYHTPDHSKWSGTSVIDFPMHWNFQYARDAYNVAVNNDKYYNDATYNVVYVDSHDYGPDGAEKIRYNEGTNAWRENMSLMFTFRGVPCIYYGSEIEFQKGKTIDEGPNLALKDSGRAYFGDHLEGSVTATGFGEYTATGKVKETLNYTLAAHLRMLNKIRAKVPALRRGQYASFGDLKFVRRYTVNGKDSVAAVAISGGQTFSGLPNGRYVDLVSGASYNVTGGTLSANVSGQGNLAVYVLDNGVSGTLGKIS